MGEIKKNIPPRIGSHDGNIPPKDASPTPDSMPPREAPRTSKPTKTTD